MLDMLDLTATQLLENGPDYIVRSSFYMREVRPLRIVVCFDGRITSHDHSFTSVLFERSPVPHVSIATCYAFYTKCHVIVLY